MVEWSGRNWRGGRKEPGVELSSGNLQPEGAGEVCVGSTPRFASLWSRDGPDIRPFYIRTTGYPVTYSQNAQERCVWVARPDSHPYGVGMDRISGLFISGLSDIRQLGEVCVGSTPIFAYLFSRYGSNDPPDILYPSYRITCIRPDFAGFGPVCS